MRRHPVLACNGTGFDPRWSRFRSALWAQEAPGAAPGGASRALLREAEELLFANASWHAELSAVARELFSGGALRPRRGAPAARGCAPGLLTALFLLARAGEHPGPGAATARLLEAALFAPAPLGLWWLLDGSAWPLRAAEALGLLERAGRPPPAPGARAAPAWRPCACLPPPTLGAAAAGAWRPRPRPRAARPRPLRVAALANHNYAFDVLLGLLEAAEGQGLGPRASVLGYELAERFPLARQNCAALGGICRGNARLNALVLALSLGSAGETEHHANLVPDAAAAAARAPGEPGEPAPPLSLSAALGELASIWSEEQLLNSADLLLCGYPYVLCYLIDDMPVAASAPMLVPLHGTIVSEYVDARLHSWVFGILRRWMFGNTTASVSGSDANGPQELPRCVVAVNYIEQAWIQRTLGPISFVPLGARHLHRFVRHAIGRREAEKGLMYSSSRVALHRISWALPIGDARGFLQLLLDGASLAKSRVQPVFLSRSHEDWELLNFRAAVLIPWDWEITTFIELYRLPLPLFLPDDDFMTVLIWRTLRQGELRRQQRFIRFRAEWWRGAPCHMAPAPCNNTRADGAAARVAAGGGRPPWLSAEAGALHEQIRGWYAETDYRRFPHVGRFSGLADLLRLISTFEPRDAARGMRRANAAALRASASAYAALLAAL